MTCAVYRVAVPCELCLFERHDPLVVDTVFVADPSTEGDTASIRRKPAYTMWDGRITDWGSDPATRRRRSGRVCRSLVVLVG